MPDRVTPIPLRLPYRLGSVSCYLVQTGAGAFLIDSGGSNQRRALEAELERLGCSPGDLKLIVLTHGDFDHSGNAAYLRGKYHAKLAIHPGDSGILGDGDMFWNRKMRNIFIKKAVPLVFRFGEAERCQPDLWIEDGFDLTEFGYAAHVLSTPGHSSGSICILSAAGDLFCGDLLVNTAKGPALNSIMDDPAVGAASLEKLKHLEFTTIYPGHGDPFPARLFLTNGGMPS
jgi:hydroxyacylglutathione hydrolase